MLLDVIERLKRKSNEADGFCFTMDVDWASDVVIEYAVHYFKEREIPLTLFFTHRSHYIDQLVYNNEVAYGIHPNFIQPSSQGASKEEVVQYCMTQFPQAKAFRGHRWYADNDVYTSLYDKGIRYDSNLCTLLDVVPPFLHRSGMLSFPVFFEDGAYLYHELDLDFTSARSYFMQKGVKVINIHPMHLVINTPYFKYMRNIKDTLSREEWNDFSLESIDAYQNRTKTGISDFISECIEYTKKTKQETYTLEELYGMLKG